MLLRKNAVLLQRTQLIDAAFTDLFNWEVSFGLWVFAEFLLPVGSKELAVLRILI